jgi:hypothetical protein
MLLYLSDASSVLQRTSFLQQEELFYHTRLIVLLLHGAQLQQEETQWASKIQGLRLIQHHRLGRSTLGL